MKEKYGIIAMKLFKGIGNQQKERKDRFFMNETLDKAVELGIFFFYRDSLRVVENYNYQKIVMELMLKNELLVSKVGARQNSMLFNELESDELLFKTLELMRCVYVESDLEKEMSIFELVEEDFFGLIEELLLFEEKDSVLMDLFVLIVFDYLEGRSLIGSTLEFLFAVKDGGVNNFSEIPA